MADPTVIGLALVSVIAAVVFLRVEAARADGFVDLTLFESQSGPLSDLFLGRTDKIAIRFAAAIALLFNVLMVVGRDHRYRFDRAQG